MSPAKLQQQKRSSQASPSSRSSQANRRPKARRSGADAGTTPTTTTADGNKRSTGENAAKPRRRFLSRWFILVIVALVVIVGMAGPWFYNSARYWYRARREELVRTQTLAAIEDYNRRLRTENASLETTAGIADYARKALDLVEEGDHGIVVTRDGKPLQAEQDTREAAIADIPETARPFGSWTPFLDSLFLEN
ncbi:MAG: hypothetical protein LBS17_04415 [Actinomycetes bacterium]|jgi:cell division protein FtsB|nr:hypothetical protein [Actinomycetes bacterium]